MGALHVPGMDKLTFEMAEIIGGVAYRAYFSNSVYKKRGFLDILDILLRRPAKELIQVIGTAYKVYGKVPTNATIQVEIYDKGLLKDERLEVFLKVKKQEYAAKGITLKADKFENTSKNLDSVKGKDTIVIHESEFEYLSNMDSRKCQ